MEKISSILPTNSRIKTVDLEEARPARPGSPTFGRPIGTTASDRDKISISAAARVNLMKELEPILQQKNQNQVNQEPEINDSLVELSGTSINKYA